MSGENNAGRIIRYIWHSFPKQSFKLYYFIIAITFLSLSLASKIQLMNLPVSTVNREADIFSEMRLWLCQGHWICSKPNIHFSPLEVFVFQVFIKNSTFLVSKWKFPLKVYHLILGLGKDVRKFFKSI